MVEKLEKLYEGKAKKIYRTTDENLYWVEYKDDATAFNGLKKGSIADKGFYNNKISAIFFEMLESRGIPTHFVSLISDREMLVKRLEIIPIEVVVRNIAAGSMSKRLGIAEGTPLQKPVVELYYKNDDLGDPLITEDHVEVLNLSNLDQLEKVKEQALKINEVLKEFLAGINIQLVDFKLEFGLHNGQILLGDEISPDTCRFWDMATQEKLDKDRFRRDLGKVTEAYAEVYRRLTERS